MSNGSASAFLIMPTKLMPTSQPPDLIAAARTEAKRRGMSLSAFVGESIRKQLPRDVRNQLEERPKNGGDRRSEDAIINRP